ncbi:MAG: recombinase family protein, partial [Prevotella sp.]
MTSPYDQMTAVLYVRTSTDDKGQIPAMQMEDMDRWCKYNNVEILKTFTDEGYTGGNMQRPGMMSMLGFLAMNKVHIVLAQDWTRISRDNNDMERFLSIIKPYGTVLRYTTADIIPEDGMGKTINYMATNQGEQWRKQHSLK